MEGVENQRELEIVVSSEEVNSSEGILLPVVHAT